MSYFYIPELPKKDEAIGNALSAFNISLSSLDLNLSNLSAETYEMIEETNTNLFNLSAETYEMIEETNTNLFNLSAEVYDNPFGTLDVQIFTASGIWIDPYPTKNLPCEIMLIGGGGGGGGGRGGPSNEIISGGGGGGGGSIVKITTTTGYIHELSSTFGYDVIVGIGGFGGIGVEGVDDGISFGNSGQAGGNTTFMGIIAEGGNGGSDIVGGSSKINSCLILDTALNSLSGGTGNIDGQSAIAGRPCGGGAGASWDGTSISSYSLGGKPGNNIITPTSAPLMGAGGNGGAEEEDPGQDGFIYGGGGGGGSFTAGGENGFSGSGGKGADGIAIIKTYLY